MGIAKKKKKLFLYVFFPGESSRTKKSEKKLCRADFDLRAPYIKNLIIEYVLAQLKLLQ
jgi:hypothetical protein